MPGAFKASAAARLAMAPLACASSRLVRLPNVAYAFRALASASPSFGRRLQGIIAFAGLYLPCLGQQLAPLGCGELLLSCLPVDTRIWRRGRQHPRRRGHGDVAHRHTQ
jgi:hypothetical protein